MLMQRFRTQHRQLGGEAPLCSVALGDGRNDLPMLGRVDLPVLIPSPGGVGMNTAGIVGLRTAHKTGPHGWSAEVERLLDLDGATQSAPASASTALRPRKAEPC